MSSKPISKRISIAMRSRIQSEEILSYDVVRYRETYEKLEVDYVPD
jgi:hypothetical protein